MIGASNWSPYGRQVAPPGIPWSCTAPPGAPPHSWSAGISIGWASPTGAVDSERHPEAAERLRWWTGGYASHPTVYVGGKVLIEPTMSELSRALARSRLQ
jgi:mycoredoxin